MKNIVFGFLVLFGSVWPGCDPGPSLDPVVGLWWVKKDPDQHRIGSVVLFPNNQFGWSSDTNNISQSFTPIGNWMWTPGDTLIMEWDTAGPVYLNLITTNNPGFSFYDHTNDHKLIFNPLSQ